MIILEFLGMVLSIIGVIYIAKANNLAIYKANIMFYCSNLLLFTFFLFNGMVAIFLQMSFFFITSIIGIIRLSTNTNRDIKLIIITFIIYLLILLISTYFYNLENFQFKFNTLDVLAALMAMIGAYLLPFDNKNKRNMAYLLFILADILYVYIGYMNMFYFFMFQSFLYIFTSSIGIYNNNQLKSDKTNLNLN